LRRCSPSRKDNSTPLHIASWIGNSEIVTVLLEQGARIDLGTNVRPLHHLVIASSSPRPSSR